MMVRLLSASCVLCGVELMYYAPGGRNQQPLPMLVDAEVLRKDLTRFEHGGIGLQEDGSWLLPPVCDGQIQVEVE